MEDLKDRWMKCVDCGSEYLWEIGEQKYYKERGYLAPRHCPSCRKIRKINRMEGNKNA